MKLGEQVSQLYTAEKLKVQVKGVMVDTNMLLGYINNLRAQPDQSVVYGLEAHFADGAYFDRHGSSLFWGPHSEVCTLASLVRDGHV